MDYLFKKIPGALLPWYEEHARKLPWREDKEPYHVWISEIMLQQTRVEAVKDYYTRFLRALPTVEALASCEDERLMKLWEGLGYYSRVRNMKKAAQIIVHGYGGAFPNEYAEVLALPGIGAYTAGAICSICYDMPTPAVDGNVLRVIARITNDNTPIDGTDYKKFVQEKLAAVYPQQAGKFTQALMELGATLCGPNRKAECENCPCKSVCLANRYQTVNQLPVRLPKKQRREEDRTVFILHCDGQYALTRRPEKGLLANMWQFPDVPGMLEPQNALAKIEAMGLQPECVHRQSDRVHIFTHVQWNLRGYYIDVKKPSECFAWFTAEQVNTEAALPTAYRQFWDR